MADPFLQELDAVAAVDPSYVLPISDDPAGTGDLKKVAVADLLVAGQITGLAEEVQDLLAAALVEGSNVTITYDDGAGTVEIAAGGGVTDHGALSGLTDDDHSSVYVALAPGSTARNVVQAAAATAVPLTLKGAAGQSANLLELRNSLDVLLFSINQTGNTLKGPAGDDLFVNTRNGDRMRIGSGRVSIVTELGIGSSPSTPDIFLNRSAAEQLTIILGSLANITTIQLDANSTPGNTRLLVWDVTAGTLKRVSVGAADSGGAGFKLLRVPN